MQIDKKRLKSHLAAFVAANCIKLVKVLFLCADATLIVYKKFGLELCEQTALGRYN